MGGNRVILQERKDFIRRALDKFQHAETCPRRDFTFMEQKNTQRCGVGCLACRRIIELPGEESPMKWGEAFHEVKIESDGPGDILESLK